MKVVRLSAVRTGRLYSSGNIPGTHFCYRLSRRQSHSAAGRVMCMKNCCDTIGNRTHYLPACSAVPQPTEPGTSTWYLTILTTDMNALGMIRTLISRKRAAAESHALGRAATGKGSFIWYTIYIVVAKGRSCIVTLSVCGLRPWTDFCFFFFHYNKHARFLVKCHRQTSAVATPHRKAH